MRQISIGTYMILAAVVLAALDGEVPGFKDMSKLTSLAYGTMTVRFSARLTRRWEFGGMGCDLRRSNGSEKVKILP